MLFYQDVYFSFKFFTDVLIKLLYRFFAIGYVFLFFAHYLQVFHLFTGFETIKMREKIDTSICNLFKYCIKIVRKMSFTFILVINRLWRLR